MGSDWIWVMDSGPDCEIPLMYILCIEGEIKMYYIRRYHQIKKSFNQLHNVLNATMFKLILEIIRQIILIRIVSY